MITCNRNGLIVSSLTIFDKAPTYEEIVSGTKSLSPVIALNRVFVQKNNKNNSLAGRAGLEPIEHAGGGSYLMRLAWAVN